MFRLQLFEQEAEEKAKEEEIAATTANKGGKKGSQAPRPVDTDPDGDKLMHVCKLQLPLLAVLLLLFEIL